jgi:hypothetical protein
MGFEPEFVLQERGKREEVAARGRRHNERTRNAPLVSGSEIFAADPLTCGACGARVRIIFFITDPCVVDRIVRHCQSECCRT